MKTVKTMMYVSSVIAFYLLAVASTIYLQKDVGGERISVASNQ